MSLKLTGIAGVSLLIFPSIALALSSTQSKGSATVTNEKLEHVASVLNVGRFAFTPIASTIRAPIASAA